MRKKLSTVILEEVYCGLHVKIGLGRISRFLDRLVRPHAVDSELDASYHATALDEKREKAAQEWTENLSIY